LKKALIIGISGQDGAYLSKLLLGKGYEVHGTSRDATTNSFRRLRDLGTLDNVHLHSMMPGDFNRVMGILDSVRPDEVYNLAGQSAVGMSFQRPVETIESIAVGTLRLLEAVRCMGNPIRIFSAGSVECFGEAGEIVTEDTVLKPVSPYGVAKASALWEVAGYRQSYGLFACTGILSNHESPLRSERFVTQKIVSAACRIARGSKETLFVGNLDITRDWGWADEYVTAMWLMLQQQQPRDYVLGTGRSYTLHELIEHTFRLLELDWSSHTQVRSEFIRGSDILRLAVDPSKAHREIGWQAQITMPDVLRRMLTEEWARTAESHGMLPAGIGPQRGICSPANILGERTLFDLRMRANGTDQNTKEASK
jgi:GDPmannose 4,6-dehydratase